MPPSLRKETDIDQCLLGEKLYGDDFSPEDIAQWFEQEREGYAGLWAKARPRYQYEYHALNWAHAFRHVQNRKFSHVLSIGGAYGDELLPIVQSMSRVTILEPSDSFVSNDLHGVPVRYVKPHSSGLMPFAEHTFDLLTCFGCLHHIPNVTTVVGELFRCLIPGGLAFIREPTISMGDWRQERKGLTKMERGIPLQIFRTIVLSAGFTIRKETRCGFPIISRLPFLFGKQVYNSKKAVALDRVLARWSAWNSSYHSVSLKGKIQPTAVAYFLEKPV